QSPPPLKLGDPEEPVDELLEPPEDAKVDLFLLAEETAPPTLPGTDAPFQSAIRNPQSAIQVLAAVWLLGALGCLLRSLAHLALLYRWARRAWPIRDPEWLSCLTSLAERYRLPAVALRHSPAVTSPLTVGLFRPVILLPTGRRTWSAEQRALVLAHELAHV